MNNHSNHNKQGRLRLLQIGTAINFGSTGKIAEQIGELALQRGWDSYIAHSARYARSTKLKDISTSDSFSESMHYFGTLLTDRQGLFSRTTTQKLVDKLSQIHPDIIHLHNIHGHFINYKILFNYIAEENVPAVWTLHDCWPMTGHCTHFEQLHCSKWEDGCHHCEMISTYPRALVDASRKNWCDKKKWFNTPEKMVVVTVSQWLGGLAKRSILKRYPIETIYNGVDTNIFSIFDNDEVLSKYGLFKKKYIIGVANQWGERKGLNDLIQLSKLLPKELYLVLVGLTEQQVQYLAECGIKGILRTENQRELAALYSGALITLNLSYQETFGMSTVESYACGTPVIAYNATASPELIRKETGWLTEPGDIANVAKIISDYYTMVNSNPSIIASLQNSCRTLALNDFDRQKNFAKYFNIYDKLLSF